MIGKFYAHCKAQMQQKSETESKRFEVSDCLYIVGVFQRLHPHILATYKVVLSGLSPTTETVNTKAEDAD